MGFGYEQRAVEGGMRSEDGDAMEQGEAVSVLPGRGEEAGETGARSADGGREARMGEVSFVIPGAPKGKARHRSVPLMRGGKPVLGAGGRPVVIAHSDSKTVEYENLVRLQAQLAMQGRALLNGALAMEVRVFLCVPASWSKKKRAAALAGTVRPTGKPDWDNLGKAVSDGCNAIVFGDDSAVTSALVTKRYADVPRVEVRIWQEAQAAN